MNDATLINTGAAGAVVGAVCCATPILVVAVGAAGLDYVLLPALAPSIGLVSYGLYRRGQGTACCETNISSTTGWYQE